MQTYVRLSPSDVNDFSLHDILSTTLGEHHVQKLITLKLDEKKINMTILTITNVTVQQGSHFTKVFFSRQGASQAICLSGAFLLHSFCSQFFVSWHMKLHMHLNYAHEINKLLFSEYFLHSWLTFNSFENLMIILENCNVAQMIKNWFLHFLYVKQIGLLQFFGIDVTS